MRAVPDKDCFAVEGIARQRQEVKLTDLLPPFHDDGVTPFMRVGCS